MSKQAEYLSRKLARFLKFKYIYSVASLGSFSFTGLLNCNHFGEGLNTVCNVLVHLLGKTCTLQN
jgi:hypothetical protein